jgi:tetratricopeptide (TPR) repeat protein
MPTSAVLPDQADLQEPLLPGHYALRARLGAGGFGEVYEAWDSKLCRSVAIKCIKRAHGGAAAPDLLREARMGASLRHAAFVQVHAIEDMGATQSIVMELVRGRTLREALQPGAIDLPTALDWMRQTAEAMQDAHASGLVHGDLKPSNLMIEPTGKVRVLDFGLALHVDVLATISLPAATLQGTIAYMAPERLMGAPPSAQADVYALGVVLYEMVCGTRPFADLGGLGLAAAQLQSASYSWSYPDTLPPALIGLIRAMTAREPAQRLAGMPAVLAHLQQVARPGTAAPLALRRWRPGRIVRRAGWIGVGVLAVALLGAGAWQAIPWVQALAPSPYSQAHEMDQGLAALMVFDRPGSLDAAEGHFRRILAHSPDHAAAAAGMAMVYIDRYLSDRRDETWLQKAQASAQQARQRDDQLALGHAATGWVLDSQGHPGAALAEHAQALRLDPANFFAWFGRVAALRHAHRYDETRTALAEAMARYPSERVFTDEAGVLAYDQADYPGAERAFRRSIALQPDAVISYANLNAALLRQNRDDEALRVLQQGLQVRPSARLYTNLGNALFLRQDYAGAAAAFDNAVSPTRGNPSDYVNWANLGDTLNWIPGREAQARAAYDRARTLLAPLLQRAPNDVLLVSRMALYAARSGAAAEARALAQHALRLAPDNADVQFRAALAYELLGERGAALAAVGNARRLGYPAKFIEAEPDLVALRRDQHYRPD